ncbi:hypothetical protein GCM10010919_17220 [Alishewanella longhuensis]|uniref:Uncharacterized protein n=1 Tax=Alishewanella longhuensis TaxID=1091037 RepID=A0ABQ3L6C5_9ALTE|nr:hypothetical protein [Alishewanella longhuensis]GHG68067.1 hypothetical protein GCM10010919_17220 [Alishewanella longhuensis]
MTKTFKKSLLALAVAGFAGQAMAATVDNTAVVVSTEYLQVAPTGTLTSNDLNVVLGAEYTLNDVITITFAAAPTNQLPANITVTGQDPVLFPNGLKGITLGKLNQTGNVVTYRVTDIAGAPSQKTTGQTIPFSTVTFERSAVTANSGMPVTFTAQLNNNANAGSLEGAAQDNLFNLKSQFTVAATTLFDQIIDVEADRLVFVNAETDDTGVFALTDNGGGFDFDADLDLVKYTVTGNFGWIVNPANAIANGVIDITGCSGLANAVVTASAITFNCDDYGSVTVDIDTAANGGASVLPTQRFTLATEVTYSDGPATASKVVAAATGLGSWGINASQTFIPYMPFNRTGANATSGISQIITVTNTADVQSVANNDTDYAAVTVDVLLENGTVVTLTKDDLMVQALPGVTRIAGQIRNAMAAKGLTDGGAATRYAGLTVLVNASASDIQVYSAYNVGGNDRGWVQNDSVVTKQVAGLQTQIDELNNVSAGNVEAAVAAALNTYGASTATNVTDAQVAIEAILATLATQASVDGLENLSVADIQGLNLATSANVSDTQAALELVLATLATQASVDGLNNLSAAEVQTAVCAAVAGATNGTVDLSSVVGDVTGGEATASGNAAAALSFILNCNP